MSESEIEYKIVQKKYSNEAKTDQVIYFTFPDLASVMIYYYGCFTYTSSLVLFQANSFLNNIYIFFKSEIVSDNIR